MQRLPVRIQLDPKELEQHPLRIGLSMDVDVTIKSEEGGNLGAAANTVYQTNVFDKYDADADQKMIARIIEQNAGRGPGAAPTASSSTSRNQRATKSASTAKLMYDMVQQNVVHAPLEGGKLVLGTIAVSLAVFMNVLDTSIANVSIPSISDDLGIASDQGTWVITSFAFANAISVPLTG